MSYAITSGQGMLIIEPFGFVCLFVLVPPPINLSLNGKCLLFSPEMLRSPPFDMHTI